MREILEKYLNKTLAVETKVFPLKKQLLQLLPVYIVSSYEIFEATIFEQRIILLLAQNENAATPDNLLKQKELLEKTLTFPIVFVFEKASSYHVQRYIRKKLDFIIPNKQMFVPTLLLDLRKMPETLPVKAEKLTPIAQFLLLYHLQKELLNDLTIRQLSEKFAQSYLNINRAVNCLKELNLVKLAGGKEKQIVFAEKGKNLWQKAQQYFQNPASRTLFTDEKLNLLKSNINALAHYTMLNDEQRQHYAIGKQDFKNLKIKTNKHIGDNEIEIWRYNPHLLTERTFVDRLSLYLLLKESDNERIEIELEALINEIQWLEE